MLTLHKKVNKRETLIGWYSFCKKIMNNDPIINKILYSYTKKPLFILLWVDRLINGLIIEAYFGKKFNSNKNQIFQKKKIFIGMLESEDTAVHQILRDSRKWTKKFQSSILTTWFQIFTSFSRFFRKVFKQKIILSKYKNLRADIFLTNEITESIRNFQFIKNGFSSDLTLLYFLNILKLTMQLENDLFQIIL
jgi:hypothetical protein